jgi:hypothetical protein
MKYEVLYIDKNDWEGAALALAALQGDIESVSGVKPEITGDVPSLSGMAVIAGTIGKSSVIDRLAANGTVDLSNITGKRESYLLQSVPDPVPGVSRALIVAGSDKRGTIYGIYKISELIGVSPWVWWADSQPERRDTLTFPDDLRIEQGEPSVKYRGIFLNDEAPCLTGWAANFFGDTLNPEASKGYVSAFYAKVFELILRLKGNYLWPAMWNSSFHTDDALNSRLADTYGIVMGTSHQEHMTCADKEWSWSGLGEWNYFTNRDNILKFWGNGVEGRKGYESILTLGMRGQCDTAILGEDALLKDNIDLIQKVLGDQRAIIRDVYGAEDAPPQLLALYKEVEDFYYGCEESGKLCVPGDVTLLLCDDNHGNVRTLPHGAMKDRPGGFGMYYHFDYRGAPVSYQWINQTPLVKVWEQMTMAYDAGVDRIWIVNAGDLKPMELPIDYFLNLAYDYEKWSPPNKTEEFTRAFAAREFGQAFAGDAASVLTGYTKILGARKAEVVMPSTFSHTAFDEAGRVLRGFEAVVEKAEAVYAALPPHKKDTFFQLALYPARAAMNVYKTNILTAQGKTQEAKQAFEQDAADTEYYNTVMSGGKWNGIMRQNHFGYTAWDCASTFAIPNIMPKPQPSAAAPPSADPDSYISIGPKNFARASGGDVKWTVIDGYGRDGDSIKVLPNGRPFDIGDANAPYVEYDFTVAHPGDYAVNTFIAPTGNSVHQTITPLLEQLRFSTQVDDSKRRTASGLLSPCYKPGGDEETWAFGVMNNTRLVTTEGGFLSVGRHTLRITAVDPGVVIQKIVVALKTERQTKIDDAPQTHHFMGAYFGPPVNHS